MKRIIFLLFFLIIFTISCYVIPTRVPRLENMTISIPFGDTTVEIIDVIMDNPDKLRYSIDTVFARTDVVWWRSASHLPVNGPQTIHINIEELLPDEIIDLDSTVFGSSVDKLINAFEIYGNVYENTGGYFRHNIYNRNGDTIYQDSFDIMLYADPGADSAFVYDSMFRHAVLNLPVGDYEHDVDLVIDSGNLIIDSAYGYSEAALNFHLGGDTVITLWRDRTLLSPPDSTPISLLRSIDINIDVWNRIPLGEKLIVNLNDSMGNNVFCDTEDISIPDVDLAGTTTGEPAHTFMNFHIDSTIYDLFKYETMVYKAKLQIPVSSSGQVHVRPNDYIRISGNIIINFDIDDNKLSDTFKFVQE